MWAAASLQHTIFLITKNKHYSNTDDEDLVFKTQRCSNPILHKTKNVWWWSSVVSDKYQMHFSRMKCDIQNWDIKIICNLVTSCNSQWISKLTCSVVNSRYLIDEVLNTDTQFIPHSYLLQFSLSQIRKLYIHSLQNNRWWNHSILRYPPTTALSSKKFKAWYYRQDYLKSQF